MNVAAWLRELGLEEYLQAFRDNDVDGETLRRLTERDLADIGVKSIGHRRKLWAAIGRLSDTLPTTDPAETLLPNGLPAQAEHRQISVLYCDMVGSTALSGRLDPEDYREVIRSFHDACTRTVAAHDGFVANFIGDCVLVYFGWPLAHEDDAERAVRAASALIKAVGGLRSDEPVAVRISIATGVVVIGDLVREGPAQEQSALGQAPYLAAELQTLTLPGQIVIDEATRRLLGSSYRMRSQGSLALPGMSETVAAWLIVGERTADSRFDAQAGKSLAPMVGRDQELALLLERWAQARRGEGQAVLLVGEAGIGKSRIARALIDASAARPHWPVRWQCSPYHMGSALWPVIQRVGRSAGLEGEASNDAALDKLEALSGPSPQARALYAALLGLDGAQRYGPLEMSPQMMRERTLELLVAQLVEATEQRPLLLVIEDAHWIDPTTLELIERCLERIDAVRMFILITSRPDNQPALAAHPNVTRLSLNRLSRAGVEAIVARLAGDSLHPQTLATIVTQTDGVPLFVEELTKAVLETGEAAIPASLHGSLMARLDRIPEVKEVAQIAACIGREFDQALLQAVAENPEAVAMAVDRLAAAELIFRRGDRANPRFTFKHALVQEAAYASLLRGRRQAVHARILEALETQRAETPSEILARHAQCAMHTGKSIDYWQHAGNAAYAKSAYAEAANFLTQAVRLIRAQPDSPDRRAQEFELQLSLGRANIAFLGYGAADTRKAFECAHRLVDASQAGSMRDIQAQHGLWAWHYAHGHCNECVQLATRILSAAQAHGDLAQVLAHRVLGASYLHSGELSRARDHLVRSLALFDRHATGAATQLGVNPGATGRAFLGWVLALMGLSADAQEMLRRSRAVGLALSQADARVNTHLHCAMGAACLRDVEAVRADAQALAELSSKHRLRMYKGYADVLLGWVATESGQPAGGAIALYERGFAELAAAGSRNYVPLFLGGFATSLAACGRHDEALQTIDRTLADSAQMGQGWCDAELQRLRGELLARGPHRDDAQAAHAFEQAVATARRRGARLWELRAAASLQQLRGRTTRA